VVAFLLSYHVVSLDLLGGESGRRTLKVSLDRGYTVADVQDRIFKLSVRQAATQFSARQPTLMMFGEPWIPGGNPAWVKDESLPAYRQKDGQVYVSSAIIDEGRLRDLKQKGFRLVVWRGEKWEFERATDFPWRDYVEVIDDLSAFFGVPIRGRGLMER
jgi:hypothetical protein